MNYLAHLYFSEPSVESRVGNLLGDFARGIDMDALPRNVLRGVRNHRAIDHFTDHHPQVRQLKTLFSPQRRRFAGIALDVLFDHFLIHHWQRFSNDTLHHFLDQAYADLQTGYPLMPQEMRQTVSRMINGDWIRSYQQLAQVGVALDRIAGRVRFRNAFAGSITELEQHYAVLEQGFLQFFPAAIEHHRRTSPEITID